MHQPPPKDPKAVCREQATKAYNAAMSLARLTPLSAPTFAAQAAYFAALQLCERVGK